MSWDILVQDLPEVTTVADIPDGFQPSPLGARSELISKILTVCPQADFSDPSWGLIVGPDWSIEVNIGKEEPCMGFALHVRGADVAVSAVTAILEQLQLRAIDCQTSEFFTEGIESKSSFHDWQAYRNRVIGGHNSEPL